MHNKGKGKLLPMSRIAPKRNELSEIDTVASAKRYGGRRAFDILMEAAVLLESDGGLSKRPGTQ